MTEKSIAIIGAGIAGLATAFECIERNPSVRVDVFEATSRVGGNIRTEIDGGYVCEWGPEGFLDNTPETLDLVRRAGLDTALVRAVPQAHKRFILRDGKLRLVPLKPPAFFASDLLPLRDRLRVVLEPLIPAKRDDVDESVFDFAARRIGKGAATHLIDAMVGGVFAGDSHRLSLQSAFPKMHAMERQYGGLVKAMLARQREARKIGAQVGGPSGPRGTLTTFDGGMQRFVDALADAVGRERIHLNRRVKSAIRTGGRWRLVFDDGADFIADVVIDTTPAAIAAQTYAATSLELSESLERIPFASIAVVGLGYRREDVGHPLDGFGLLIPRVEGLHTLGVLFTSSVFPDRTPDGHVLIRAMIGGATNPQAVDWSDEDLLDVCRREIDPILAIKSPPAWQRIFRYRRGIAQYNIGHAEILQRINQTLASLPDLHLTGTSYTGIAVNAACQDARKVAATILPGSV